MGLEDAYQIAFFGSFEELNPTMYEHIVEKEVAYSIHTDSYAYPKSIIQRSNA